MADADQPKTVADMAAPSESLQRALDSRLPDHKIALVLELATTATLVDRDGTERPDHKTRLAAAQVALAYRHGRPIERQQVLTAQVKDTDADLIERLAHSPALRAAIRDAVEAAEKRGSAATSSVST